mmetsp:Transcript_23099/g.19393  ORF Transcript_23099/g.19393 Transcript_23099/m.19393 type:complete len:116 (+) Transcript_23099:66-413(+)
MTHLNALLNNVAALNADVEVEAEKLHQRLDAKVYLERLKEQKGFVQEDPAAKEREELRKKKEEDHSWRGLFGKCASRTLALPVYAKKTRGLRNTCRLGYCQKRRGTRALPFGCCL